MRYAPNHQRATLPRSTVNETSSARSTTTAKKNGNWSIAVMHNLLFQPLPPGAIIGPPKRNTPQLRGGATVIIESVWEQLN